MPILLLIFPLLQFAWNSITAKNSLDSPTKEVLAANFTVRTSNHQPPTLPFVVNLSPKIITDVDAPDNMEWRFYEGYRKPTMEELMRKGKIARSRVFSSFALRTSGFGISADEWSGEGWFIAKFRADSLLPFTNRLALWIPRQFGDSKLFLDGKPLQTFALNPNLHRRNILAFTTIDSGEHELAIQYQDRDLAITSRQFGFFSGFTGLSVAFGSEQSVLSLVSAAERIDRGFFGASVALILLVALHLLFFLFSPSEKVHFFYALQTALLAQMYLPQSIIAEVLGDTHTIWGMQNILNNSLRMLILPAVVAMLTSLIFTSTLSKRHKMVVWSIAIMTVTALLLQIAYPLFFNEQAPRLAILISTIISSLFCLIEIIRLLVIGIRQNRNLLWLASGGIFLLVAAVLGLARMAAAGTSSVSFGLPFIAAGLGFQIGMSLFLAWQSAQTRRNLTRSLQEVQTLSAQMLEQERRAALLQLQKERERFRAETLAKEAEFTALKMQINPHFLFNSLASIRTLSRIQPEVAHEAISRLSSLFRYALQSAKQETVPLKEEIRIVKDYLELERLRFEDRLTAEVAIPSELENIPIPPMTIQILVENAVKHGIEEMRNGGNIHIEAELAENAVLIRVSNTGKLKTQVQGNGIGLNNSRERLRMLFGSSAQITLKEISASNSDSENCTRVQAEVRYEILMTNNQ